MKIRSLSWTGVLLCVLGFAVATSLDGLRSAASAAEGKGKPETSKLNIGLAVPALSYLPCWVADH
jgi:hypothetical protein